MDPWVSRLHKDQRWFLQFTRDGFVLFQCECTEFKTHRISQTKLTQVSILNLLISPPLSLRGDPISIVAKRMSHTGIASPSPLQSPRRVNLIVSKFQLKNCRNKLGMHADRFLQPCHLPHLTGDENTWKVNLNCRLSEPSHQGRTFLPWQGLHHRFKEGAVKNVQFPRSEHKNIFLAFLHTVFSAAAHFWVLIGTVFAPFAFLKVLFAVFSTRHHMNYMPASCSMPKQFYVLTSNLWGENPDLDPRIAPISNYFVRFDCIDRNVFWAKT